MTIVIIITYAKLKPTSFSCSKRGVGCLDFGKSNADSEFDEAMGPRLGSIKWEGDRMLNEYNWVDFEEA